MNKPKRVAIIFAGGAGQRMGSELPKQFLTVYGKPILIHTLEKFQLHEEIDEIYLACIKEYIPYTKKLLKKYGITKMAKNGVLAGGTTGQDSIYLALKRAREFNDGDAIVLIHDGVRPIITDEVISRNIKSVEKYGSAITCTPSFETPVISRDGKKVEETPYRDTVYTAQAPQSFRIDDILAVHEEIRKINPNYQGVVDSCTLMRSANKEVRIIEGNRGNIKVTTPNDYMQLLANLQTDDYRKLFDLETSLNTK